jgi:hypothetical protein
MRTGVNVAYGLNLRTVLVTTDDRHSRDARHRLSNNQLLRFWPRALPILIVNDPSRAVLFRPS